PGPGLPDEPRGHGRLPVPQGAPAAMGPSADDLFAGLGVGDEEPLALEDASGAAPPGGFGGSGAGFAAEEGPEGDGLLLPYEDQGLEEEEDDLFGFGDLPQTMGAPKVRGPQMKIDASGNIVLDESSLHRTLHADDMADTEEAASTTVQSVSVYTSAYRRTPPTKWTELETEQFYEALRLYGSDLFLVQTFFRNKSTAQIKTKFQKELKKHPDKVDEALTKQAKKLTKHTFEQLHGKIDTSKHYKPPPTPPSGEDEADGSLPGQGRPSAPEEDDVPPPEPEYSAEDESLTTNRLMALFD
ncbi:unnamed protein product, partial [Prorocentrum cordatum]